jgi:fatty acid desaturase
MNYHVEHHMFPMVPYHALPELHKEMKGDCPQPYAGFGQAYREIVPTLLRQLKDPTHFARRRLPSGATPLQPGMADARAA